MHMYINTQIVRLPMFILYVYVIYSTVAIDIVNVSYTGVYKRHI